MPDALSDIQLSLLRLASRTELPSSLTQKQFLDIQLLRAVNLIEPSAFGFTITAFGAEYLRRVKEQAAREGSA